MIYLLEFLKGICISFGIIIGFIIAIVFIINKLTKYKEKPKYKTDKLYDAFSLYLNDLIINEKYEDIDDVNLILQELKNNILVDNIYTYNIKKDTTLIISDVDKKTAINFVDTYIILNKK